MRKIALLFVVFVLFAAVGYGATPTPTPTPTLVDLRMIYSTYMGGSASDWGGDISVDSGGNAYTCGYTQSVNFPTTNSYQSSRASTRDAFVYKMGPDCSLMYSTFIGGEANDRITDVFNADGFAYITGITDSFQFPTLNAYQSSYGGSTDAFYGKLSTSGSVVIYMSYLGGSGLDEGYGLRVKDEIIYVVGRTTSVDFPTISCYQPSFSGGGNAIMAKITSSGSALIYSTYFGGGGDDRAEDVGVDDDGTIYIAGRTSSTNLPTKNAYQSSYGGADYDGYVAKVTSSGSDLVYSTYVGGEVRDYFRDISVENGQAYLVGLSSSEQFPTVNPYQSSKHDPGSDVVVVKMSTSGGLSYSTYIGGTSTDFGRSIYALDNKAYLTSRVVSVDFPTKNCYQSSYGGGGQDAALTVLGSGGDEILYSTYLGGSANDEGMGVAVYGHNIYISGMTTSLNFPTLNAYQSSNAGGEENFILRLTGIDPTPTPTPCGYSDVLVSNVTGFSTGSDLDESALDFADAQLLPLSHLSDWWNDTAYRYGRFDFLSDTYVDYATFASETLVMIFAADGPMAFPDNYYFIIEYDGKTSTFRFQSDIFYDDGYAYGVDIPPAHSGGELYPKFNASGDWDLYNDILMCSLYKLAATPTPTPTSTSYIGIRGVVLKGVRIH